MAEDLDGTWTRLVAWLEAEHSGFRCRVEWKDVPGPSSFRCHSYTIH